MTTRFQRRRLKYEKLMDDGRQVMAKARMAVRKIREKKFIFAQQNKMRTCEFSWFTGPVGLWREQFFVKTVYRTLMEVMYVRMC